MATNQATEEQNLHLWMLYTKTPIVWKFHFPTANCFDIALEKPYAMVSLAPSLHIYCSSLKLRISHFSTYLTETW